MAATIRPSLILNMDIDERQYSDDVIAEIKRSYSYVAPSIVAEKPVDANNPIENVIRLVVRMHKPYWDDNDEAACEQWDAVMPKWLGNMFSKVSATVTAANAVRAKSDEIPLPYAWMEVEFGDNVTIAQAINTDSSFPENALSVVEQVRTLMGAGALGEGVVRVSVPAYALWEAQRAQACELAGGADAEDEVIEGAGETDAENGAGVAAEAALEAEKTEGIEAADACEAVDADEAAEAVEETAPSPLPFAPPFEVDRSVWGIVYADGTTRLFNSETKTFTE